jgi:hypothetical protein
MTFRRSSLALLLALGAIGTAVASARGHSVTELEQLTWQHARWETHSIRDYTWTLDSVCFCTPGPTTTQVIDGKPAATSERGSPMSTDPLDLRRAETVEDLFRQAETALGNDPSLVDISYDATYGFPSKLHVGEPPGVADAEYTTTVVSFSPAS